MEPKSVVDMFKRSENIYGVKYNIYIDDGDTKTFKQLIESKPYDDIDVRKKECLNHVKKRLGTRLRNLKKGKNEKLEDGKTIGGRGRLTKGLIESLTSLYGNAIRKNSTSVTKMKNAIDAIVLHKSSTDDEPKHHLCPEGEDSWCQYNKCKAIGNPFGVHRPTPPKCVWKKIQDVFHDASKPELLENCTGGFTQNCNECFNSLFWKYVSKKSFSGIETLELSTYIAVALFNDGSQGLRRIIDEMQISTGPNLEERFLLDYDIRRQNKSNSLIEIESIDASDHVKENNLSYQHCVRNYPAT